MNTCNNIEKEIKWNFFGTFWDIRIIYIFVCLSLVIEREALNIAVPTRVYIEYILSEVKCTLYKLKVKVLSIFCFSKINK